MSRQKNAIPTYLLHRPSGQARIRINGQDIYLGPYGSDESRKRYADLVSRAASGQRIDALAGTGPADTGISVAELALAFLDHAERHYVKPSGKQTDEVHCFRSAVRPLAEIYGLTPAREFGPNCLRAVRDAMIGLDWSRGYVNRSIGRIRHVFKWGVGRELVPATVLLGLQAVEPLMAGRTKARETRPRTTVPAESVTAVKAKLRSRFVKGLLDLQWHTGARSGELLMLTTSMIDRSQPVWTAMLDDHKTQHYGHSRVLVFGPKSQEVLAQFLNDRAPQERLFRISVRTYSEIVSRACVRAKVTKFVPHELRNTALTRIRDEAGIEAAQAIGGHSKPDMTARYTTKLTDLAKKIAESHG